MRLNFTSLLIAVVLTLFGATTAQAQTFVTHSATSTPADEIETGLYVIKGKVTDSQECWMYMGSDKLTYFCEALEESSLKNVWHVEKRTDGAFYMLNVGTGLYLRLHAGKDSETTETSNDGWDLTCTNDKSIASYFSARTFEDNTGRKMDENAFIISAGAASSTGLRQHFVIYNSNIGSKLSTWNGTIGSESVSGTQVQFDFFKADLDYTVLQSAPAMSEGCQYYLQGANGTYISTQENGQYTTDQNSARKFFVAKTEDNRFELVTNDGNNHMTISDQPWFVQKSNEDGMKVYFTLTPVSGTEYFTIHNVNGSTFQYMLNGTSGSKVGKGTNGTAENARWKFIPANDAATAAASLTANVQTGDAVHGNVTTFSASYPVAIPTGYKAYTANYDNSQNVINVTELAGNVIPANTGVLLRGDVNASLSMKPTMQTGTAVEGNVLTAVGDAAKTFESTDDKIYLLGKQNDGTLCFRHMSTNGTQTIAAHKAYINLSGLSTTELSTLRIRFDGETTGINEVPTTTTEGIDNGIYDLSGRRVSQPTHGIYIKGGKKVIL